MGAVFALFLFVAICVAAIFRPHIGLIGYFGWAILKPEYLWQWALPQDAGLQKYIALATFVGMALKGFRGNQVRGTTLYACLGLGFYLFMSWISSFQSHDQLQTDFFMDVIWKVVLMTFVAVRLLDTPQKIIAMVWVVVLAQGYNAFEINTQYFRDGYSWAFSNGWAFNDSNTYSIMAIPIMAFSAALALYSEKKWAKGLAAFVFVLQLHMILLLESRGCMLALVLLCVTIWWHAPKSASVNFAAVSALLVTAILAGPPVIKEFQSIFIEEEERDESAESRFSLWQAGWEITKDYPLLGLGPWGAETTVPEYYPGGVTANRKALHNLFFEVSTGSGIPATIGYLAFFVLPWLAIRRIWKKRNRDLPHHFRMIYISVLAGIPAYWLSSMFSSGAMLEAGYASVAIGIAALIVAGSERHHVAVPDIAGTGAHSVGAPPHQRARRTRV